MGSGNNVTFIRDSDPERENLPTTIVDEWAEWVSTQTDAPQQYHRATGVIILSTILTPFITLRVNYGTIIPNIWAMILAGTTTTRKSTSMDFATQMLDDVLDDYLLATDGSPEGLLTELAYRDGKVSLFHRDEITGFMASVSGRDYMRGILESLTRLYDGKREKRILRKESIEINKPYLIFVAGGIKSRMEEIVSVDHIRSGFLPRFLFVTGSTSADQMRPIGPPNDADIRQDGSAPRDVIHQRLWDIFKFYSESGQVATQVKIGGVTKLSTPVARQTEMTATAEAWLRIQALKNDAIKLGERTATPDLYTPMYDRLSNTVIKVAMLLAASDKRSEIGIIDVCKAIQLSQEWVEAMTSFASNIEAQPDIDKWERKAEKIVAWVRNQYPNKIVTQTDVMQKFRIRKRDIDDIEATLFARGELHIHPYPHPKSLSGTKVTYLPLSTSTMVLREPKHRWDKEDTFHAPPYGYTKEEAERVIADYHAGKRPDLRRPNQAETKPEATEEAG